ncbi:hypothetical protein OS493_034721 [Desmophyllum pertusum]|uniref:Uncharacterized protein n=1 Tax=Desmophyllum pertusum TaxID=174260 RepID=A0A9W9Z8Q2_9CNID|nr:hypothetical protein OS493_034721 [Desmophyllum pertusum]
MAKPKQQSTNTNYCREPTGSSGGTTNAVNGARDCADALKTVPQKFVWDCVFHRVCCVIYLREWAKVVVLPLAVLELLLGLRIKLRVQENIQGSLCNDFCLVLWCESCVLCQMARELNFVGGRR